MPIFQLGPMVFNSGWNPTQIKGPDKNSYVKEHQVPGAEGGVVEYLGSEQSSYQIRGFLAPFSDTFNGKALFVISGISGVALSVDDSKTTMQNIRGSGLPLLLKIESSWSQFSGVSVWYENAFFWIVKLMFALEAGRGYPYYPYTMDLKRASTHTYGNSSGILTLFPDLAPASLSGAYFSGYTRIWQMSGGNTPRGETVAGLGFYAQTARSGNARLAVYDTNLALIVQTQAQAVHSGWNYFPLNPTFTTISGRQYSLGMMSDQTNQLSNAYAQSDAGVAGISAIMSGTPFLSGFPTPFAALFGVNISGFMLDIVMVMPG